MKASTRGNAFSGSDDVMCECVCVCTTAMFGQLDPSHIGVKIDLLTIGRVLC